MKKIAVSAVTIVADKPIRAMTTAFWADFGTAGNENPATRLFLVSFACTACIMLTPFHALRVAIRSAYGLAGDRRSYKRTKVSWWPYCLSMGHCTHPDSMIPRKPLAPADGFSLAAWATTVISIWFSTDAIGPALEREKGFSTVDLSSQRNRRISASAKRGPTSSCRGGALYRT